jgi:hypothetical protein
VAGEGDELTAAIDRALDAALGPEPVEVLAEQSDELPPPLMEGHERFVRTDWLRYS